jgi:hypothetical protein
MTTEALHLTCDGCGQRSWDRADMLEAYMPEMFIPATPEFPVDLAPLTLCWVGPCCAELANQEQP